MYESTLSGDIVVYLSLLAILALWILFHRKEKRPPGPISLPLVGNFLLLAKGDVLKTFRRLRWKYSDLYSFKLGSVNAVVVNGYETTKEILSKNGDDTSDRPDVFIFRKLLRHEGIVGSSGNLWKTHRTFALTTLRNFGFGKRCIEERIMEELFRFLEEIESKNGNAFDVDNLVHASISNIICSIVFGHRFDYKDKIFIKLLGIFNEVLGLLGPSALINVFPYLEYVPADLFKAKLIQRKIAIIRSFLQELIDEHKHAYNEHLIEDYIDAYLKEMKQGRETFTDKQLQSSIMELFIGGTDTTATTIRWAILYFLHYPDVQNKMRKELDDIVGTSRSPSLSDRPNLPYCDATITEVLRCGNIAPLVQHSCHRDISINGFIIPEGTLIIGNLDSILSDSNIFENAEKFNPERFIDNNGTFYGYEKVVPFSIGRRVCLGEPLARSELFLYLTSMVQRFHFVPKDDNSLPDLQGVLGIVNMPKSYEVCALTRD